MKGNALPALRAPRPPRAREADPPQSQDDPPEAAPAGPQFQRYRDAAGGLETSLKALDALEASIAQIRAEFERVEVKDAHRSGRRDEDDLSKGVEYASATETRPF